MDFTELLRALENAEARVKELRRENAPTCAQCGTRVDNFTGWYDFELKCYRLESYCHGEIETLYVRTPLDQPPRAQTGRWLDMAFAGADGAKVRRQG